MVRRASLVLLALMVSAATSACLGRIRLEQPLPPEFGDLAAIKQVEVVDSSGQVLMKGTFDAAPESGASVQRTADLTRPDGKAPAGKASIDIERKNGVSEEEIVVSAEDLPYPASCKVMVDGREIAMFSTTQDGKIDLRIWRRVTTDAKAAGG
jgi:hypothetical protein